MIEWKKLILRHCSVQPRTSDYFTHQSVTPLSAPGVAKYLRELVSAGMLDKEGDKYVTTAIGADFAGPEIAPPKTHTNATMQERYVPRDMTAYRPGARDFLKCKSFGVRC